METVPNLDDIKKLTKPTKKFLVSLSDNTYGVRFIGFKIRDYDTGDVFHEFRSNNVYELDYFADHLLEYIFPMKILKAKTIGTYLTFVVGGEKPVKNLDFVEKHYINGELMKSYEFNFPLFMPKSENNIEFIYPVPPLKDDLKTKVTKGENIDAFSDTFIFVEGKLIIHRRAEYMYSAKMN